MTIKILILFGKYDVNLERDISSLTQLEPDAKEEYWARYFLKLLERYHRKIYLKFVLKRKINKNLVFITSPAEKIFKVFFQSRETFVCILTGSLSLGS